MFWTKEECQEWLPFVAAVAAGKRIASWTGYMESVEGKDPALFTEDDRHRFHDDKGVLYASRKDDEWRDNGNALPITHQNRVYITHPAMYLKIIE